MGRSPRQWARVPRRRREWFDASPAESGTQRPPADAREPVIKGQELIDDGGIQPETAARARRTHARPQSSKDTGPVLATMRIHCALLVLGLGVCPLTLANFLDGNELRERCESNRPDSINTCLGYLTGVADGEDASPSWKLQKSLFCVPRGVGANQLRGLMVDYFQAHPEEEDLNAAIVVGNAFLEAFPCD